jgi:hypothetical protein
MRSNAWLCLYIILNDNSPAMPMEHILSQSDPFNERHIQLILSTISLFQSYDHVQLSIKQTLAETCQFETNVLLLHYSIVFIIDHVHSSLTSDHQLLANLARALIRRHSILYLLIQYDKQEKNYQLMKKFFHWMSSILLDKLRYAVDNPIELTGNSGNTDQWSHSTQTYLILPNFHLEQVQLVEQMRMHLNMSTNVSWSTNTNKHYLPVDSILIEFLLIFLASFDSQHAQSESVRDLAHLLQQFFLNRDCTPYFMTIKQFHPPVPIKHSQDEVNDRT